MKKRFLSILLAVLLLVSLLPTAAFAADFTFKAVWNSTSETLTLYYDANAHTGEGTLYDNLPSAATAAAVCIGQFAFDIMCRDKALLYKQMFIS